MLISLSVLGSMAYDAGQSDQENTPDRTDWGWVIKEIIENDENFQEIVGTKPWSCPLGIIGENHENAKKFVRVGEEMYEIGVNLKENKLMSIEKVENQAKINWIENRIQVEVKPIG